MDPLSQAALGAVVGQAAGHARLGWRAAAIGALAGALPDLDVLFSITGDYFDELVLHRGITHSLLFAPVAGPLLGWLVWRLGRHRAGAASTSPGSWMLVATLAFWSHPLLDVLTPYGTQLLLPFSDARFAINAMPIIDPVYTLLLCSGLMIAARPLRAHAQRVALATLTLSCGYLGYGAYLNHAAESEARRQLDATGIRHAEIAAFPTIGQVHQRRVVARTDTHDRVGFLSMWQPCAIDWAAAPREPIAGLDTFRATREGRIFDWFTMGWARYHLDSAAGSPLLVATDLRYGFSDDPDRSIFSARAPVDAAGRLTGPVEAGRELAADSGEIDAVGRRLLLLLRQTYAPACRLTSR